MHIRFIAPGAKGCDRPGCNNSIPSRAYPRDQKFFYCSPGCQELDRALRHKQTTKCLYCGAVLPRQRRTERAFCVGHKAALLSQQVSIRKCGPFLALYYRYFREFGSVHYTAQEPVRHKIRDFFFSLVRQGVTHINQVEPRHISEFVRARRANGCRYPRPELVKVMFDYLIDQNLYRKPNPVRPRMHYIATEETEPRPYSAREMRQIWRYLERRGETRTKLAVAIGEESGLRIAETTKLRVSDIDLVGRRVWVGRPTKNKLEGYVPFGPKSAIWLRAWLAERDPHCRHDYLLTDQYGNRLSTQSLRYRLRAVICKSSPFRENRDGWERFSYHRLRHTAASRCIQHGMDLAVVMKIFRWKSAESAKRYLKILNQTEVASYHRAMRQAMVSEKKESSPAPVTLDQFMKARGGRGKRGRRANKSRIGRNCV